MSLYIESYIYDEELEGNHRICRGCKRRRIQKEFIETWEALGDIILIGDHE